MKDKLKLIIITVLATLGVLFVIILIMPEGEEKEAEALKDGLAKQEAEAGDEAEGAEDSAGQEEVEVEGAENSAGSEVAGDVSSIFNDEGGTEDQSDSSEDKEDTDEEASDSSRAKTGKTAKVNIPASELSDYTIDFSTVALDNSKVTQDIFSDYDITIVHLWGTYCGPCIVEMPQYAEFYKELPDNVNLVAVVIDAYEGIDSNVQEAYDILDEAGAGFLNLRASDDLYDILAQFQYIPSSFLVDREGHLIGEALEGAHFDITVDTLNKYIENS